ncbi:hypothetical protein V1477_005258 [Vespula maculifrons]|uniref:Uncharacterized protein n=1 Tax=Vespula maculifrons TaxID=7453 RepID=A0ABD2CP47_VESMC
MTVPSAVAIPEARRNVEWSTDQRPTYDHNARGNLASKARDAFHRSSSISTRLPVQRIYPPHVHLGNGELYRRA